MTNAEAIKHLSSNEIYTDDWEEAILIAKEALEKQIPKKPQIKEFPDEDEESGDRYLWTFYICPVCGEHIGLRYNKFCSNCGQALDWSDSE